MASLKINSEIYRGKLSDMAREAIIQTLRSMEGKQVEIIIKEKKRSLKQNKYRWGTVNATVMKCMNDYLERQGLPLAEEADIDLFIKKRALKIAHNINTPFGELVIRGRLKEKTTKDFEESMEAIRAHFAEKGIQIPLPKEKLDARQSETA